MPSPPPQLPPSCQFWAVSHWATFFQYLMEGPILNLTDFHLVGVLSRVVLRGSEESSETPPVAAPAAGLVTTDVTSIVNINIITRSMRILFSLLFDWV